ncbi:MAG TPA: aminoglycoside phosphotransferase family protein [Propionibacteriaceae bacterium]|nr:aminoglycoside phosphotransferase family protein [Propionibacteriaceae bacterium]
MTGRLHHDEVRIDEDLVRQLLRTQLPDLANLDLRLVPAQGTDNVVFRLGTKLSVRLPRKPAAVRSLLVEREWLPRVAPRLPLAVPLPVASGEPSGAYPFPWLVCTWLSGTPLPPAGELGAVDVDTLAEFVVALQAFDSEGGPQVQPGQRAGPVGAYDAVARAAFHETSALQAAGRIEPDLVDEEAAASVWRQAVDAPAWPEPSVWVHRDLMASNLMTVNGRLSGVLDFGGLAVGDPAGDVMAAFHLFSADGRSRYRAAVGADDATWARARGWALIQGLEALPYYLDTHPGMVAMARRVIRATLNSQEEEHPV